MIQAQSNLVVKWPDMQIEATVVAFDDDLEPVVIHPRGASRPVRACDIWPHAPYWIEEHEPLVIVPLPPGWRSKISTNEPDDIPVIAAMIDRTGHGTLVDVDALGLIQPLDARAYLIDPQCILVDKTEPAAA